MGRHHQRLRGDGRADAAHGRVPAPAAAAVAGPPGALVHLPAGVLLPPFALPAGRRPRYFLALPHGCRPVVQVLSPGGAVGARARVRGRLPHAPAVEDSKLAGNLAARGAGLRSEARGPDHHPAKAEAVAPVLPGRAGAQRAAGPRVAGHPAVARQAFDRRVRAVGRAGRQRAGTARRRRPCRLRGGGLTSTPGAGRNLRWTFSMWLLFLILILNAAVNTSDFMLRYRIDVGGLPINIFDGLMIIGLVLSLFNRERMFPAKQHPLVNKLYLLFGIAMVAGLIGWLLNGAPLRQAFMALRNWIALPIEMFIGYYYLVAPKSVSRYLKLQVLAGVVSATMILLFFSSKSESLGAWQAHTSINAYRTIDYVSNYGGLAAALLVYSVAAGVPLLPVWLALPLAGFCLVGQFAELSRSDWLATVAGLMAAFAMVPKGRRLGAAVRGTLSVFALIASLWIGMYVASRATGANFFDRMAHRVTTILPTGSEGTKDAAYLT